MDSPVPEEAVVSLGAALDLLGAQGDVLRFASRRPEEVERARAEQLK